MAIELELNADQELNRVLEDLGRELSQAPREIERGLERIQAPYRESQTMPEYYRAGTQAGRTPMQDVAELQAGEFSGIIENKIEGARRLLERAREPFARKEREQMPAVPGLEEGALSPERAVRSLKVEKLELSNAALRELGRAMAGGARAAPGGRPAGGAVVGGLAGGGGLQAGGIGGQIAGGLGRIGAAMPYVGLAAAIPAALLKLLSSMSGAYQRVIQGQDATLDVMRNLTGGAYVGGGGQLMRSPQYAQVLLERARLSETGRDVGWRGTGSFESPGIRFGLAQGIGGLEGARLFAQMRRYGGQQLSLRPDWFGGMNVRDMMAYGAQAGFGGVRQAEFFRGYQQQAQQAYMGGFGMLGMERYGRGVAGLREAGIRPENAITMFGRAQTGFQERGNILQNLALAGRMGRGETYMQGLVGAERGAVPENLQAVSRLLGLERMDRETRALIESQVLGLGTATQAMRAAKPGGLIRTMMGQKYTPEAMREADVDVAGMMRAGHSWRMQQNRLEAQMAKMSAQYALMIKVTNGIIKAMTTFQPVMDGLADTIRKILNFNRHFDF